MRHFFLLVCLSTAVFSQSLLVDTIQFSSAKEALKDVANQGSDLATVDLGVPFTVDTASTGNFVVSNDEVSDLESPGLASLGAKLIAPAHFYPNPVRLSQGTSLGYELTGSMPLTLKIYNSRGFQVFSQDYDAGLPNITSTGYNTGIRIDPSAIGTHNLPSGVYFFILMSEGSVVERGRLTLLP